MITISNLARSGFTFSDHEQAMKAKYILLNSIMLTGITLGFAMIVVHGLDLFNFSEMQQAIN
jgi:hypothetical protein